MYMKQLQTIKNVLEDTGVIMDLVDAVESCIATAVENAMVDEDIPYGEVGVIEDLQMPDTGVGDGIRTELVHMAVRELLIQQLSIFAYSRKSEEGIIMDMADIIAEYK